MVKRLNCMYYLRLAYTWVACATVALAAGIHGVDVLWNEGLIWGPINILYANRVWYKRMAYEHWNDTRLIWYSIVATTVTLLLALYYLVYHI